MVALAEGYAAIAAGQPSAFDMAITNISSLNEKHTAPIKDQLLIARQIYGPPLPDHTARS